MASFFKYFYFILALSFGLVGFFCGAAFIAGIISTAKKGMNVANISDLGYLINSWFIQLFLLIFCPIFFKLHYFFMALAEDLREGKF